MASARRCHKDHLVPTPLPTPSPRAGCSKPIQPDLDICSGIIILILVLWLSDPSWVLILTASIILCGNTHTSLDIELHTDNCLSEKSQSSMCFKKWLTCPHLWGCYLQLLKYSFQCSQYLSSKDPEVVLEIT